MGSVDKIADGLSYSEGGQASLDEPFPPCWQRFKSMVSTHPERVALVCMHQPHDLFSIPSLPLGTGEYTAAPYLRWTYSSLKSASDRLAFGLKARGVRAGMPIVTFLPNGAEYLITMMAAKIMGCPFAPLSLNQLVGKDIVSHLLGLFLQHAEAKYPVVIAQDNNVATRIDQDHGQILEGAVKLVCYSADGTPPGAAAPDDWLSFGDVMSPLAITKENPDSVETVFTCPTDEMILCTSGTTSLPKAVVYTTAKTSYDCAHMDSAADTRFTPEDVVLNALPNNHLAAWDTTSGALLFGGCLVFPGRGFDVEEVAKAFRAERVTWTNMVPTMIRALAASGVRAPCLRALCSGGSRLTPEVMSLAIDSLGAARISPVYGGTELGMVRAGNRRIGEVVRGAEVCVGRARMGQAVKVCDPEKRDTIMPVGIPGELHVSSPGVCIGYLGIPDHSAFYTDAHGRPWFATGDQARMESNGDLFIVGRYKDMIIRGGENIAPSAVEAVLDRDSELREIGIQIVGVPDEAAGEVPVAVTTKHVSTSIALRIREVVQNEMGPAYIPDELIALEQLGIKDYPRTALGKVIKGELAILSHKYRVGKTDNVQQVEVKIENNGTVEKMQAIWARALGLDDKYTPSPDTRVIDLVDSISIMRVRDRILKTFNTTLTVAEIRGAATIQEQAALIDSKPVTQAWDKMNTPQHSGQPPELEDMVHLTEHPELFDETKELIEDTIRASGLEWHDVRAVMPVYDMNRASLLSGQMNLLNVRSAVLMKSTAVDKHQVRTAVQKVLANNPMLVSFIALNRARVGPDTVLHVVVNQTQVLLDRMIRDGGSLKTVKELFEFQAAQKFPSCRDATLPGPLVQVTMFSIEERGTVGIVFNANHSIFDATFAQLIWEDLEAALAEPQESLRPHADYKAWADGYFTLRSSPAARAAVKYHEENLAGLATHRHAIWPAHPPAYVMSRTIDIPSDGADGLVRAFAVPGLAAVKERHPDVEPSIVVKAALALTLMRRTKHTHALFSHVEADRARWPFFPKSWDERSASDLGGLTIQTVVNLVSVAEEETVVSFLRRLQATQVLQTRYAAAPRVALMEALGPEAGPLVPWITNLALFSWLGSQRSQDSSFRHIELARAMASHEAFGLFVIGGVFQGSGEGKGGIWISLKGATFGQKELASFANELELVIKWLVKEENWDIKAGEFRTVSES